MGGIMQPHARSCSARGCELGQRARRSQSQTFLRHGPRKGPCQGARRRERFCWCKVALAQHHPSSNPQGWSSPPLGPVPVAEQEPFHLRAVLLPALPRMTAGRSPRLGWQPAPDLGAHGHVPVWHHRPACRPSARHRVSTVTRLGILQGSAQAGYCKWSCQTALNHALPSEIHVTETVYKAAVSCTGICTCISSITYKQGSRNTGTRVLRSRSWILATNTNYTTNNLISQLHGNISK